MSSMRNSHRPPWARASCQLAKAVSSEPACNGPVVDDAAQGVSDVVRGMDLLDNTARQIVLQKALGLPTPRHLHVPLVLGANGEKLSKQNGATALDLTDPGRCLREAAQVLAQAGWPIDPTQPLKVSPAARCPEP